MEIKRIALIIVIVNIIFCLNSLANAKEIHKMYEKIFGPKIAFKNGSEPEGFRDVKWEQNISTISGLKIIDKPDQLTTICARPSDKMKIGRVNLHTITYEFWKGKFWRVEIKIKDRIKLKEITPSAPSVSYELMQVLRSRFGGTDYVENGRLIGNIYYIASSEKVEVSLRKHRYSRSDLKLVIYNRYISEERDQYYINQGKDDF